MKHLLTLLILFFSVAAFAQEPKPEPVKPDTVLIELTDFQVQEIAIIEKQLQELSNRKEYLLNVIIDASRKVEKTDALVSLKYDPKRRGLVIVRKKK